MDTVDAVGAKYSLAVNCGFDASLGGEGARKDSNPDDSKSPG